MQFHRNPDHLQYGNESIGSVSSPSAAFRNTDSVSIVSVEESSTEIHIHLDEFRIIAL